MISTFPSETNERSCYRGAWFEQGSRQNGGRCLAFVYPDTSPKQPDSRSRIVQRALQLRIFRWRVVTEFFWMNDSDESPDYEMYFLRMFKVYSLRTFHEKQFVFNRHLLQTAGNSGRVIYFRYLNAIQFT